MHHKEVFLVGEEENLSEAGRPVREESHHQRQARRFSGKDGEGNSTEDGGLPTNKGLKAAPALRKWQTSGGRIRNRGCLPTL